MIMFPFLYRLLAEPNHENVNAFMHAYHLNHHLRMLMAGMPIFTNSAYLNMDHKTHVRLSHIAASLNRADLFRLVYGSSFKFSTQVHHEMVSKGIQAHPNFEVFSYQVVQLIEQQRILEMKSTHQNQTPIRSYAPLELLKEFKQGIMENKFDHDEKLATILMKLPVIRQYVAGGPLQSPDQSSQYVRISEQEFNQLIRQCADRKFYTSLISLVLIAPGVFSRLSHAQVFSCLVKMIHSKEVLKVALMNNQDGFTHLIVACKDHPLLITRVINLAINLGLHKLVYGITASVFASLVRPSELSSSTLRGRRYLERLEPEALQTVTLMLSNRYSLYSAEAKRLNALLLGDRLLGQPIESELTQVSQFCLNASKALGMVITDLRSASMAHHPITIRELIVQNSKLRLKSQQEDLRALMLILNYSAKAQSYLEEQFHTSMASLGFSQNANGRCGLFTYMFIHDSANLNWWVRLWLSSNQIHSLEVAVHRFNALQLHSSTAILVKSQIHVCFLERLMGQDGDPSSDPFAAYRFNRYDAALSYPSQEQMMYQRALKRLEDKSHVYPYHEVNQTLTQLWDLNTHRKANMHDDFPMQISPPLRRM